MAVSFHKEVEIEATEYKTKDGRYIIKADYARGYKGGRKRRFHVIPCSDEDKFKANESWIGGPHYTLKAAREAIALRD